MAKEPEDTLNPCGHKNSERVKASKKLPSGICPACLCERIAELENEIEEQRWILVSEDEELPKRIKGLFKSKECFVTDGKTVWVAAYNYSAYYWQCSSGEVTHWKPIILPKP